MADAEELRNDTASEVHTKRFKENEVGIQKLGDQFILPCANDSIKSAGDGPSYQTSNPSRSHSNLVQDISGCLLGEENDKAELIFGAFQEASFIDIML